MTKSPEDIIAGAPLHLTAYTRGARDTSAPIGQTNHFANTEKRLDLLDKVAMPAPPYYGGVNHMDTLFNMGVTERVVSVENPNLNLGTLRSDLPPETARLFGYQLLSRGPLFMKGQFYNDWGGRPGAGLAWCAALSEGDAEEVLAAVRADPLRVRRLTTYCLREVFQFPESVVRPLDYEQLDTVTTGIAFTTHPEVVKPEGIFLLQSSAEDTEHGPKSAENKRALIAKVLKGAERLTPSETNGTLLETIADLSILLEKLAEAGGITAEQLRDAQDRLR